MIFHPNLSPKEIIRMGSFGGIYFNSSNNIKIDYREFPSDWFNGVPENFYLSDQYNKNVNFFKIKSGQDQDEWENKGWIHPQDPRGWFQWYCRYYLGRRTKDDERQIKRWGIFVAKKEDGEIIFIEKFLIRIQQLTIIVSREPLDNLYFIGDIPLIRLIMIFGKFKMDIKSCILIVGKFHS